MNAYPGQNLEICQSRSHGEPKIVSSFAGVPKIAQVWPTVLAHDGISAAYHTDDHFLEFLRRNQKNLDNSFFFFLSDHGPRADGVSSQRFHCKHVRSGRNCRRPIVEGVDSAPLLNVTSKLGCARKYFKVSFKYWCWFLFTKTFSVVIVKVGGQNYKAKQSSTQHSSFRHFYRTY